MLSRLKGKFSYLFSARWALTKPPRAQVAILDSTGSDELREYLEDFSCHVIDLDRREINLRVLFHALVRLRFDLLGYLVSYLTFVQPRMCITLIDTTPFIYRLKQYFPSITTVSIQNGWRGFETAQDFSNIQGPLTIDHLFCFGEASRDLYQNAITGNFHLIGSFRSNKVPVHRNPKSNVVALISTLRSKVNLNDFIPTYSNQPQIRFADLFERRLQLAGIVAHFCQSNDLKLLVLGKDADSIRERELYESILDERGLEWEFQPRVNVLSNYYHLNDARIVISTGSSLGYEALARGTRTAFFMLNPEATGNFGDRFGWPAPLADEGPIWTNYLNFEKTLEVLQRLHELSDDDWLYLRKDFVPSLISIDQENTMLRATIHDVLSDELRHR